MRYIEEPQVRVAPPKQDAQEVEEITETTSKFLQLKQLYLYIMGARHKQITNQSKIFPYLLIVLIFALIIKKKGADSFIMLCSINLPPNLISVKWCFSHTQQKRYLVCSTCDITH